MSFELLYTSTPQGLKQGSRGFATVLCTTGLPSNVAMRLETLSGYRHVFPPQHPQASGNPVAWAHLRLTISGRPTSILSRVAAYGSDYSGRTNKLAHHVVVEAGEAAAAGPAWLLAQPGLMRSDWDNACQTPPTGPAIPAGNQPTAICERWRQVTGDAGWGGVIAEAIAGGGSKPLWIVFSVDQSSELLGMIDESIALLPLAKRWQATFSTYFTNLPPEVDCKIRCVLAGTEEARLARGTVIDLTQELGPAPESRFTRAARTGANDGNFAEGPDASSPQPDQAELEPLFASDQPKSVGDPEDSLGPGRAHRPPRPPGLAVAPPPVTTRRRQPRRSIYAAVTSAIVLMLATAAWAVSQRQSAESKVVAKPRQMEVSTQSSHQQQGPSKADHGPATDPAELQELERLHNEITAETNKWGEELRRIGTDTDKLKSRVSAVAVRINNEKMQLDDELKEIEDVHSVLKEYDKQLELSRSRFVRDLNQQEIAKSASSGKSPATGVPSLPADLDETATRAKVEVSGLSVPGAVMQGHELEELGGGLGLAKETLQAIRIKMQAAEFRAALEALPDTSKRQQMEEEINIQDVKLTDTTTELALIEAELIKLAEFDIEEVANHNQTLLASTKEKYLQLAQEHSELNAQVRDSRYRLVLSLNSPPSARNNDEQPQLVLSGQTDLHFDDLTEVNAVRWNAAPDLQPFRAGGSLFVNDSVSQNRLDVLGVPVPNGVKFVSVEVDRSSGTMRIGFKIDTFTDSDTGGQAARCFEFLDNCLAVFNDAGKCGKWRPAEMSSQDIEKDVFSHRLNLASTAQNLQELVKLLGEHQQKAIRSEKRLALLKAEAEEASPKEMRAIREADVRLRDIRSLINSIEECNVSVEALQDGELLSLGNATLRAPDRDLIPGTKVEANMDFLLVIPEFSKVGK